MKKILLFGSTLIMALCMCTPEGRKQPQDFSYQPDYKQLKVDTLRLKQIDVLLQDYVDKGIIPHALTFIAKNGQVIHNKTFGWRDVEAQTALEKDDIFRMYSQTKAINTVALMTLFEQGKFQLDDPVSRYIPEMTDQVIIPGGDPYAPKTRKAASPVLIRHLLSHTSGIQGARQPRGTPARQYDTLKDIVVNLVQAPLIFDPGTGWNYHPASDVMAYLVEYFSGKPLQAYLKEVIFDPLGIVDMAYYYDEEYRKRFVTCYRADSTGKIAPVEMWSNVPRSPFESDRRLAQGGTGLNGTIEGYARFCQMVLNYGKFNGQRILGRRTLEIMAKDQLAHPEGSDDSFRFGLGFQIYPGESNRWEVGNGSSPMVSPGALSWGGMANTDYIIDPKEDMIILLYTNRVPDTLVWEKFLNTVYQALE
ncbi:MAG: beta-lactamase family protein [Tannerella sp.]|jgi:CubicO group peptidase (beta-lactamase class C family)|nr:beta-lactamase family protein [Tannerella sp.]